MITGWEHSVESMQVGEMVDLKCAPEFAYGQQGSPTSIPPDATLYYEVRIRAKTGKLSTGA